jgi:autotransporter-associated beta strand protein
VGAGFAVRDPATGRLRAIAAGELSSVLGADGTTANYGFSTSQAAWGSQTVNSLTLNSGGGVSGTLDSQLTVSSGGILAFAGNAGLGLGRVTTGGAVTAVFHTLGTGTLSLDGSVIGSTAGIVKAGDGTLLLNRRQYYTDTAGTNGTTINGGTLRLAAGDNTILVRTTAVAATPTLIGLFANGGRLDLNGATQLVERVQSVGTLPGTGGVIAGAAGSRLVSSFATVSSTFAGTITGAVEFQKAGSGVLTLTNGHDTTGAVIVRGGGLTLRDSGSFSATSSVTICHSNIRIDFGVSPSRSSSCRASAMQSLSSDSAPITTRQYLATTRVQRPAPASSSAGSASSRRAARSSGAPMRSCRRTPSRRCR